MSAASPKGDHPNSHSVKRARNCELIVRSSCASVLHPGAAARADRGTPPWLIRLFPPPPVYTACDDASGGDAPPNQTPPDAHRGAFEIASGFNLQGSAQI